MRLINGNELDRHIESVMAKHEIPGVSAVVVDGDEVVYAKGFGYRDSAKRLPATPETVFGIASVTKSFTALAIMQLQEKGKLKLEDPVKKYLPRFNLPGVDSDSVTIYHFLTHTSGLPPIPALNYSMTANTPGCSGSSQRIDTYDDLIEYLSGADFQILGAPGKYCSYSNDAYALLGAIIAKVSGVPYDRYVWENIFIPLEMNRSSLGVEQIHVMDNVSSLYDRGKSGRVFRDPNWQVAPPYLSCGWIKSSAMDLSRYVRMYIGSGTFGGRRLVSPAGTASMIEPRHEFYGFEKGVRYGYGLMVKRNFNGATLVSHGGNLKGIASEIGFVPERKIGAVVLSNLTKAPAVKIFEGAVNVAMGLPADQENDPCEPREWSHESLAKIVGRFKSGEGSEIVVSLEDNHLKAEIDGTAVSLKTTGDNSAVISMNGQESVATFLFDDHGNVWAVGFRGRILCKSLK